MCASSDKAVSRLPVTVEARGRTLARPCVICDVQNVNGIGCCQCTWPFRVSIVLPMLCGHSSDILSPVLYDSNK
jgi:hypothetical protein